MKEHRLSAGSIWEGDWLEAPLEPGFTLAILDGPYGMGKAEWDKMGVDGLAEFYRPHLERVSDLCAPSASMYVWNTAEGWARIDPVCREMGWTFRALITWEKTNGQAQKATADVRTWPDLTEVCGFYQREPDFAAVVDREVRASGLSTTEIAYRVTGNRTGAVRNWAWYGHGIEPKNWGRLHTVLNDLGAHEVLPGALRWRLQLLQSVRRLTEEEAVAEYNAARVPFTLPPGFTNVWSTPQVQGSERLKGADGAALHPCQKPLAFAERMILASSRPRDRVLVPFGGTCREAVVLEHLARTEPEKARRHDTCELNADGKDYIGAAIRQATGQSTRRQARGQVSLFGQQHG